MPPRWASLPLLALLLPFALGGAEDPAEPAKPTKFAHASLAVYPKAVITLKEPQSGTIFYVESHGRRVVALDREGALLWGVDVFEETQLKASEGTRVVRQLTFADGTLWVVCGKKEHVRIDVKSGRAEYAGRD